jgi:hypothetical protein
MLALVVLLALGFAPSAPHVADSAQCPHRPPSMAPLVAVDETQPVEVPSPSDKALQYYSSGNLLWLLRPGLVVPAPRGTCWQLVSLPACEHGRSDSAAACCFGLAIYFVLFNVLTSSR